MRLRKDGRCAFLYNRGVNVYITPDLSVQDALQAYPELVQVFFRHKMDCVGCYLQRFCTLEDAAVSYTIPPNDLLAEIWQEIPASKGE